MKQQDRQKQIEAFEKAFKDQIEEQKSNKQLLQEIVSDIDKQKSVLKALNKEVEASHKNLSNINSDIVTAKSELDKTVSLTNLSKQALQNDKELFDKDVKEFEKYKRETRSSIDIELRAIVEKTKKIKSAEDDIARLSKMITKKEIELLSMEKDILERKVLIENELERTVLLTKNLDKDKTETLKKKEEYEQLIVSIQKCQLALDLKERAINEKEVQLNSREIEQHELDIELKAKRIELIHLTDKTKNLIKINKLEEDVK